MAVNLVVGFATVLVVGCFVLWRFWPRGRTWIEAPKYQPLDWNKEPSRHGDPRSPN